MFSKDKSKLERYKEEARLHFPSAFSYPTGQGNVCAVALEPFGKEFYALYEDEAWGDALKYIKERGL